MSSENFHTVMLTVAYDIIDKDYADTVTAAPIVSKPPTVYSGGRQSMVTKQNIFLFTVNIAIWKQVGNKN